MELHFSAEKEALIHQFAARTGKDTAQVIEEAVDRMLEYDARFASAVEKGRAAARRGDLLEHEAVVERIERILSAEADRILSSVADSCGGDPTRAVSELLMAHESIESFLGEFESENATELIRKRDQAQRDFAQGIRFPGRR